MDQATAETIVSRIGMVWIVLAVIASSMIVFYVLLIALIRAYRKEIVSLREDINEIRDMVEGNDADLLDGMEELLTSSNEQKESYKNVIFRLSIMEERLDMRQMTLDYKLKRGPGRPPKEE